VRTAGVDGVTPQAVRIPSQFLSELRDHLKSRAFTPSAVRERRIPKAGGKVRRLGITSARDRVVQAAPKPLLEPILEADVEPYSYGFRPRRRAQDAIAEIHHLASAYRNYEWVFEAGITASRTGFAGGSNTATHGGNLEYRAITAQWHADRRATWRRF
jgi:RNA-directed DNA polymerase